MSDKNIELKPYYNRQIITWLVIGLLIIFLLDVLLGSVDIKPGEMIKAIFNSNDAIVTKILFQFRLPKAVTALIVGIALSISGLQMQTLFRNPMAGPYVLGISSGASLGVAFVILGFSSTMTPDVIKSAGNWAIAAASWVGAGAVMMLIMFISSRVKNIMTVLILGIMISSGISAIVSIMQYFSNESLLKTYVIWTLGSLGNLTGIQLKVMLVSVVLGLFICLFSVKMLNALLLGEVYARSIGLDVRSARTLTICGASILAGTVTAFCGPVGFIGIAVPHLARFMFKTSDHKILIPGSVLIGGIVMLASDIISQLPGSENVIPINSVTSLIGIPVVIWIIVRDHKYREIF